MDTEFTTLGAGADLISIGLVTVDGRQFYGERRDFDRTSVSDFVTKTVLPLLGKRPDCVFAGNSLHHAITQWLYSFEDVEGGAEIRVDYNGDWDWLADLLAHEVPPFITWRNIRHHVDESARRAFFQMTGLPEHHALNDALALRWAYREEAIFG